MLQLVSHKSFFIVYVDASDLCNELAFALGPSTTEEMSRAGVLTAVTRSWNIKVRLNITIFFSHLLILASLLYFSPINLFSCNKVTQYDCDYNNLAPDGCTQYFWGATSDVVRTYNFQNDPARHLADQNQNICIR